MNTEDRKIVAAQQYAIKNSDNTGQLMKLKNTWLDGFETAKEIIQENLQTLEQLRDDINNLPLIEQMLKSRDLDRINNKIEVIQSLL